MTSRAIAYLAATAALAATCAGCQSQRPGRSPTEVVLPQPPRVRSAIARTASIGDSAYQAALRALAPVPNPDPGAVLRAGTDSLVVDVRRHAARGPAHQSISLTGRIWRIDRSLMETGWDPIVYLATDTGDTLRLQLPPGGKRKFCRIIDSLAEGDSVVVGGVAHGETVEARWLRRAVR